MVIYTGISGSSERSGTGERLTSSVPGSPVSPIQRPGAARSPKGLTRKGTSGPRHGMSFGWWDPSGSCLRTWQRSLPGMGEDIHMLARFSESFPNWGTMQDGEFIAQPMPARLISEDGGGSSHIPTPTRADVYTGKMRSSQQSEGSMHSVSLPDYVARRWATPTARDYKVTGKNYNLYHKAFSSSNVAVQVFIENEGMEGSLNPDWVEQYLMSLPEGWTRLEPLPDGAYDEWFDAMRDGTWWDTERGLPQITTGVENRVNRLKMLGNGIVPATLALFLTDD